VGSGANERPFGSVFWFNGAREIWFVEAVNQRMDTLNLNEDALDLMFHHRKANFGRRRESWGYHIVFGPDRTTFTPRDGQPEQPRQNRGGQSGGQPRAERTPPLEARIAAVLREHGPQTTDQLVERLGARRNSIKLEVALCCFD
jgi:hypothetical protein